MQESKEKPKILRYGEYNGQYLYRLVANLSPSESEIYFYILENLDPKTYTIILHYSMFKMSVSRYCRTLNMLKKIKFLDRVTKRAALPNQTPPLNCYVINPFLLIPEEKYKAKLEAFWDKYTFRRRIMK